MMSLKRRKTTLTRPAPQYLEALRKSSHLVAYSANLSIPQAPVEPTSFVERDGLG